MTDIEQIKDLLAKVAPMLPIVTVMGEEYATVEFGEGNGHSSQAMTMNPEHWDALNSLTALTSTIAQALIDSRAREDALREALALARNRLQRCAVEMPTGSRQMAEWSEWADEATKALAAYPPTNHETEVM